MRRRTRGIFVAEVVAAIVLLAAVMVLLATSLHARQRVDQRMDARLAAMDAARATLLCRQNGQPAPQFDGVRIATRTLDAPAAADAQWIAVRATAGQHQVELIGLVPAPAPSTQPTKAGVP